MDNASHTALVRQSGLLKEFRTVAQNMANMATTGYRREGLIFSEFVKDLGAEHPSLSLANGNVRSSDFSQGALFQTGGTFDLAIEGSGFFLVATPDGDQLTRAGAFTPSENGTLVAPDGAALLDAGGAQIFIPIDARVIAVGADGTLSADGAPVAQIGVWQPEDRLSVSRTDGVRFDPAGNVSLEENARVLQGFLEKSNVDPVQEMSRMIEVQRAYELGQSLLDREDERIRSTIRTIGQQ